MEKMTQKELEEVAPQSSHKGLWFSLNKGAVSFSRDYGKANSKEEVTVRFFMSYDEWKDIENFFSKEG